MYLENYQVNTCITTTQSENIASTHKLFVFLLNFFTTFPSIVVNFTILLPTFLYNYITIMHF